MHCCQSRLWPTLLNFSKKKIIHILSQYHCYHGNAINKNDLHLKHLTNQCSWNRKPRIGEHPVLGARKHVSPSPTQHRNRKEATGPLWCIPLTSGHHAACGRLRQEDQELEASLGSTETQHSLKNKRKGRRGEGRRFQGLRMQLRAQLSVSTCPAEQPGTLVLEKQQQTSQTSKTLLTEKLSLPARAGPENQSGPHWCSQRGD